MARIRIEDLEAEPAREVGSSTRDAAAPGLILFRSEKFLPFPPGGDALRNPLHLYLRDVQRPFLT